MLIWIRMTIGTVLLVLPLLFSLFGFATALALLCLGYLLNRLAIDAIIEAGGAKQSYLQLVEDLLPQWIA